MTINFEEFFIRAGKAMHVGNQLDTSGGTTLPASVLAILDTLHTEWQVNTISAGFDGTEDTGDSATIEMLQVGNALLSGLDSYKFSCNTAVSTLVSSYLTKLLLQTVKEDLGSDRSVLECLEELIRQMRAGSDTLEETAFNATVIAYGTDLDPSPSDNSINGNGILLLSSTHSNGENLAHQKSETIVFTADSSSGFDGRSNVDSNISPTHPDYLSSGSGNTSLITSVGGGMLLNASFENEDAVISDLPADWTITGANVVLGTNVKMTDVATQTLTISGTPSSGWYRLTYEHDYGDGAGSDTQYSDEIPYDSSASAVQSAMNGFDGLESVTVASTGSEPNLVFTITFTGATDPIQDSDSLGVTYSFNQGSIAQAAGTAASSFVRSGGVSLMLDTGTSGGSDVSEMYLFQEIDVEPSTCYCLGMFVGIDNTATAGGLVSLFLTDGVEGDILENASGDDCGAITYYTALTAFNASNMPIGLVSVFVETPAILPKNVYFRASVNGAAEDDEDVYLDDMFCHPATQLYAGGPYYTLIDGTIPWQEGDVIRGTIGSVSSRGIIHTWMDRCFDLANNNLLFPTAAVPTIKDGIVK